MLILLGPAELQILLVSWTYGDCIGRCHIYVSVYCMFYCAGFVCLTAFVICLGVVA